MEKATSHFRDFYPHYLHAHSNTINRRLHFAGATFFFALTTIAIISGHYWLIAVAVLLGYLLPGIGHHHFEHNKSFRASRPVFCVIGALFLYIDCLSFGLFNRLYFSRFKA